jgi:nucleotide-binding universal stress UspA family protein
MTSLVMLCTDGSDDAIEALRAALPILAPTDRTVVVTVESPADPEFTTGTGFSGRVGDDLSDQIETSGDRAALRHLGDTVTALQLGDPSRGVELMAVVGRPGPAICELATSLGATAIVIGNSGRSGLRRAMIGSTSDHVVRHAPCPVVVQGVGHG